MGELLITNRKSILPWHPTGPGEPKSGINPVLESSVPADVPLLPEPLSPVVVVPELLEPDDDPLDEPSDTVVSPGVVVNDDESDEGA